MAMNAKVLARKKPRLRHGTGATGCRKIALVSSAVLLAAASLAMPLRATAADQHEIARGKYLVTVGSCTDCHTPGHFFGKPDMSKYLGGSDVGFAIPHLGVFVGPNLTPDKATGLGDWTTVQIVNAITKGQTPQGRTLAPVMPWHAYASLTKADALAIAAYLKSLPAVSHQVAGPFGPNETPTSFVMAVIPGAVYAGIANPPPPSPAPPPAPPAAPAQMAPPPPPPTSAPPPAPAGK
jgi:cytochrome c